MKIAVIDDLRKLCCKHHRSYGNFPPKAYQNHGYTANGYNLILIVGEIPLIQGKFDVTWSILPHPDNQSSENTYLGYHVHAHSIPSQCFKPEEHVATSQCCLDTLQFGEAARRLKPFLDRCKVFWDLQPLFYSSVKLEEN